MFDWRWLLVIGLGAYGLLGLLLVSHHQALPLFRWQKMALLLVYGVVFAVLSYLTLFLLFLGYNA